METYLLPFETAPKDKSERRSVDRSQVGSVRRAQSDNAKSLSPSCQTEMQRIRK
ncbi:hypothetical protein ANI02nite_34010 [Acetobacter nitrogenifigens DSM 23921 = NBRC 105050]|uniref:Uncharacterized protein n=1 Tax=Acetobacter nitrogenifigens DSM 23921 = NBRC 105050 TaxID=1120919 RepID=A0A511XEZ4_9PROT|nr:hypothetical protein ANI02nite_34010 [Acetobacter nitrogenifigens DSM 23921 = NBRC 105050]